MKSLIIILMLFSASAFGGDLLDGGLCKRDNECESGACSQNNNGEWRCGVYKPVSAGIKNGGKCNGTEASSDCESGWCKQDKKNLNKFACHKQLKDGEHCLGSGECESKKCADPNGINYQAWSGEFNSRKMCGALGALTHHCKENFECKSNYCGYTASQTTKDCQKKPDEVLRQEKLQEYYKQLSENKMGLTTRSNHEVILIMVLSILVSCSSLVGAQALGLAYNLPNYEGELQDDHKRNIECLKAKQCVSYWDKEAGIYVVKRLDGSELKALGR